MGCVPIISGFDSRRSPQRTMFKLPMNVEAMREFAELMETLSEPPKNVSTVKGYAMNKGYHRLLEHARTRSLVDLMSEYAEYEDILNDFHTYEVEDKLGE